MKVRVVPVDAFIETPSLFIDTIRFYGITNNPNSAVSYYTCQDRHGQDHEGDERLSQSLDP